MSSTASIALSAALLASPFGAGGGLLASRDRASLQDAARLAADRVHDASSATEGLAHAADGLAPPPAEAQKDPPDADSADDDAEADAAFDAMLGPGADEPATEDGATDASSTTEARDPTAKLDDAQGTIRAGAAPTDDVSLEDVFGDGTAIEALPDAEAEGESKSAKQGYFAGKLEMRFRVVSSIYFDIDVPYRESTLEPFERWSKGQGPRGISRNENRLEFYFAYSPNKHVQIVGDIEPVMFGVAPARTLNDLSSRQMLEPFHVESDAAYIALHDILPGLDIKAGRQIVVWGTADKFNPTNNINSDDLEDRPLFTEPIANQMLVLEYAPLRDKLWFQGVYIPLFYPALLPPSAALALRDPQSLPPYVSQEDIDAIRYLQGFIRANPVFNPRVLSHVQQPAPDFRNGQTAFKTGWKAGPIDMSASYYYGFHDIPLPYLVRSQQLAAPNMDPMLDKAPEDRFWFQSDVYMAYPRMHVAGLDFTTQLPFLGNMGFWGEAGLFIPNGRGTYRPLPFVPNADAGTCNEGDVSGRTFKMCTEFPIAIDPYPNDGVAAPISKLTGYTAGATSGGASHPFVKSTIGVDYTAGKHVYLQAQYLHGFIDEFGAGHMGDYLVGGTDLIFFGRHLVFRTFAVVDFPRLDKSLPRSNTGPYAIVGFNDDKASVVVAPDLIIVPPWGFATFELGGFAFFGRYDTKFGQPATGSSIVYFKVTGQF